MSRRLIIIDEPTDAKSQLSTELVNVILTKIQDPSKLTQAVLKAIDLVEPMKLPRTRGKQKEKAAAPAPQPNLPGA